MGGRGEERRSGPRGPGQAADGGPAFKEAGGNVEFSKVGRKARPCLAVVHAFRHLSVSHLQYACKKTHTDDVLYGTVRQHQRGYQGCLFKLFLCIRHLTMPGQDGGSCCRQAGCRPDPRRAGQPNSSSLRLTCRYAYALPHRPGARACGAQPPPRPCPVSSTRCCWRAQPPARWAPPDAGLQTPLPRYSRGVSWRRSRRSTPATPTMP